MQLISRLGMSLSPNSRQKLKKLNPNKATTLGNIPPKLLQTNLGICVESLQKVFNECARNCQFPDELKTADVSLLFMKDAYTS